MKPMGYYCAGVLLLLLVLVTVATAQPITPPVVITAPGTYELVADARGINDVYGIKIESSDVTIDGQSYFVGGTNRDKSAGVFVNKYGSSITNVTIKNLKLENWDTGVGYEYVKGVEGDINLISNCDIINTNTAVDLKYSDRVTVESNLIRETSTGIAIQSLSTKILVDKNTIKDSGVGISVLNTDEVTISDNNVNSCQVYGVEVTDSTNLDLNRNSISDNTYAALRIDNIQNGVITSNNFSKTETGAVFVVGNDVSDVQVTDNYFGSVTNIAIDDISSGIVWNTTLQTGVNILGGPYLGGNYWGSAPGLEGESDKADDVDGYGICDEPIVINDYNTDYLPLHQSAEKGPAPLHVPIIPALPYSGDDSDTESNESVPVDFLSEPAEGNNTSTVSVQTIPENMSSTSLVSGNFTPVTNETSAIVENSTTSGNTSRILSMMNESVTNAFAVDEVEPAFQITAQVEEPVLSVDQTPAPVLLPSPGIGYLTFTPLNPGSSVTLKTSAGTDVILDPSSERNLTVPVPAEPQVYISWIVQAPGYMPVSGTIDTYPKADETVVITVWQQPEQTAAAYASAPVQESAAFSFPVSAVPSSEPGFNLNETVPIQTMIPGPVVPQNGSAFGSAFSMYDHVNTTTDTGSIVMTNAADGTMTPGHVISASAGPGGSIFPEGSVSVKDGESVAFVMTPYDGNKMTSLMVDGISRSPVYEYRFTNVTSDHIIVAGFA